MVKLTKKINNVQKHK